MRFRLLDCSRDGADEMYWDQMLRQPTFFSDICHSPILSALLVKRYNQRVDDRFNCSGKRFYELLQSRFSNMSGDNYAAINQVRFGVCVCLFVC